jgi:hypothetical protein
MSTAMTAVVAPSTPTTTAVVLSPPTLTTTPAAVPSPVPTTTAAVASPPNPDDGCGSEGADADGDHGAGGALHGSTG